MTKIGKRFNDYASQRRNIMKPRTVILLGITALGAGLWTGAAWQAWAKPPAPAAETTVAREGQAPERSSRWMAKLNLTQEQIDRLKPVRAKRNRLMIKLTADQKIRQLELTEESMKDQPNEKRIRQLAKQIGELYEQMVLERTRSMMFLRSLLTPEQKRTLDEMQLMRGGPELSQSRNRRPDRHR
jgi:Spy/CpxP family protein refolding chaperone